MATATDTKMAQAFKSPFCTDTLKSYTCTCMEGFIDIDSTNPGRSCSEKAPCCQSIQISQNIDAVF